MQTTVSTIGHNDLCANCGNESLQSFTEAEGFDHNAQKLSVDVEFSVCSLCGEEAILPDQIQRNDSRVRDARRKADGLTG